VTRLGCPYLWSGPANTAWAPGRKPGRRVVYQYSFKRHKHDDKTINHQIAKAERITTGEAPIKNVKFLKVTGAARTLNQATIDRARRLAGLKGYVTNVPQTQMPGQAIIDAYHDLYKVEESFRMAKSDLRARPIHHSDRANIEAHITLVFAGLAVGRYLQTVTGLTISRLVKQLRPLRSAVISVAGHTLTAQPELSPQIKQILAKINQQEGH
jgi:hypothetical protein